MNAKSLVRPGLSLAGSLATAGCGATAEPELAEADAICITEAAGFIVETDSDVLRFDSDDMTQHVFSEGIRGYTNRFVLKLRKPN